MDNKKYKEQEHKEYKEARDTKDMYCCEKPPVIKSKNKKTILKELIRYRDKLNNISGNTYGKS